MKVRFYGRLADIFDREVDLDLPMPATVSDVRRKFSTEQPDAGLDDARVRTLVDGHVAGDEEVLDVGATVEFLAPLSGG